jgi:2-desacetyl-2-hydroxyethyl bacteriochlorophyllide A dehydrogenase
MKALVLRKPEDLAVSDLPRWELESGQALIRVRYCGICGSDVRYFYGENPWAKQTLGKEIPNPPNIVLGHEFVGYVEEVADKADVALVGKRVAVNTFITCGRCAYCRSDQENLCPDTRHLGHAQGWGQKDFYPGGMAEFCPVPVSQIYELPEHVSDEDATFLDPMIAALHAVDVGAPKVLDKVAIYGAGPIGLLIAQFVKIYGASRTFICDVADENIIAAKTVGVDCALNIAENPTAFRDSVGSQTGGRGVDLVFNTIGTNESIVESLEMLDKGGTLVLMATKDKDVVFPALSLSGERTIKTSSNAIYSDFSRALELLATGQIDVQTLITHRFPLTQGVRAFEVACNKESSGAIKIIIDCQS